MLLAKSIKPLCLTFLIQTKVKTSTDWAILEKSPLDAPCDPLVCKQEFRELLKRAERGPMLKTKSAKPLGPSVLTLSKVKTSTDGGILEE